MVIYYNRGVRLTSTLNIAETTRDLEPDRKITKR